MEADWEAEIGPDAAVIDAFWDGLIDLRRELANAETIEKIEEARELPALRTALLHINQSPLGFDPTQSGSAGHEAGASTCASVWTSKCDVWATENCDPYEFEADQTDADRVLACYIDLLPLEGVVFTKSQEAENWARGAVSLLRVARCSCCRADLIIRQACAGDLSGFGITAYLAGCGRDQGAARKSLSGALDCFVESLWTFDKCPRQ